MKRLITGMVCLSLAAGLAGCKYEAIETTAASTSAATEESATETEETTTEATTETSAETSEETTLPTETMEVDKFDLLKGFDTFELESDDLVDGVWKDVISNTDKGENKSPALSWEPVEGATSYVIYMVDLDATYWMHWKADEVTETKLPQGWAEKFYVGPYPPEGQEHRYDIYVVALKNPVERVKGMNDATNDKFPEFIQSLDVDAEGNEGNIISYGHVYGTFTAG